MKKQIEVTAKTVEDAVDLACGRLEKKKEELEIEVLEQPKKGFFGVGATEAKILVKYEMKPEEIAKERTEDQSDH